MNPNPTQPVTGTTRGETPRTDHQLEQDSFLLHRGVHWVYADFARTLEKELNFVCESSAATVRQCNEATEAMQTALTAATQRAEAAERLLNEINREQPISIEMRRFIFNHFERHAATKNRGAT